MHGLVFETSVYYWQDQPGYYPMAWTESQVHLPEPKNRLRHLRSTWAGRTKAEGANSNRV